MLSRGGLYALQAVLHLARAEQGDPVPASRMATELDLPPEYLAKVLRKLRAEGMLASTRGARGGYRLLSDPRALTVEEVVRPFEDVQPLRRCLLGGPCTTERPCAAHMRRLEWNEARARILANTRLVDLLPGPNGKGTRPELPTLTDRT